MTSLERVINLRYVFLTFKPKKEKEKPINTCTFLFCMYWYFSIYSEEFFWPQYMYHKMSPNNGFCWCPLGKFSHLGLEQLVYIAWCYQNTTVFDFFQVLWKYLVLIFFNSACHVKVGQRIPKFILHTILNVYICINFINKGISTIQKLNER